MRTQIVNLIPGVLDVEWNEENQRAVGRGEATLADPRLLLMALPERQAYIEDAIANGTIDDTGVIWLAPTLAERES